jgi:chromate reductase, NAD(P)H dehydrogenase (quinone)
MKFLAFAASHRPGSYNRKLAMIAAGMAQDRGAHVDFAEYEAFDMPLYNDAEVDKGFFPPAAGSFARRMESANGMIVSSPEYNWSYPASLKNIIDWTSRIDGTPMKGKTVLLLCATPGSRGGIVCLNHLRPPFEALGMVVFNKAFPLGKCKEAINASDNLADREQQQRLLEIVGDFVTFTEKLSK